MQLIWTVDQSIAIPIDKVELFQIHEKMSNSSIENAPFTREFKEMMKKESNFKVHAVNSNNDHFAVFEADSKEECVEFIESIERITNESH